MVVNAAPWLSSGDNAWQITAATLVGLMSVPGLVVLYGGVMQKRWSINSMMLTFVAFAVVLIVWVLWAYKMGFGQPLFGGNAGPKHASGFFNNFIGKPGPVLSPGSEQNQANIPLIGSTAFPESGLVYFQFVFAAITPILMLGSILGRVNIKAWIPFCALWCTVVYTVDAFLLWGGGFFAQKGAIDFSGGYVIHLSAGVSGFVAAAVIGPRLQRDREIDAPNNVAMVAIGAGLLWLGWNGFNGGDPYTANPSMAAAVLNTNLCTAVAFMIWVAWDYITGRKPSLIGGVNGMITGLVAITPIAIAPHPFT
jgi:Amt family ammonium transporter